MDWIWLVSLSRLLLTFWLRGLLVVAGYGGFLSSLGRWLLICSVSCAVFGAWVVVILFDFGVVWVCC